MHLCEKTFGGGGGGLNIETSLHVLVFEHSAHQRRLFLWVQPF